MESSATTEANAPRPSKPGGWGIPGTGLLKGLAVTGKNFIQSYYKKERMTTVQYPEERAPISPNFRNFPFLVFDENPEEGLRCTACSICEKSCPPQCIYIVMDRDENGKAKKRPKVFDIDLTVCMNCGICSEVCPFDSIYMDGEYELSSDDRFGGLVFGLDRLAKSAEYHMSLRPEQATEVMDRRREAEEKKAKAAAAKAAKAKADAAKKAAEEKAKAEAAEAAEATEAGQSDEKGDSE